MKTWITSDLHFGHKNIMTFCPVTRARYKGDVDYMNEMMVQEWNEMVAPEDLTYILGDVAFCGAQKATEFMQRLNGRKILIEGNHDVKLVKHQPFRDCFEEITQYKKIVVDGTNVIMFHYPIAEWDQMHRGAVHFHGHLHGEKSGLEQYRAVDVGMDATWRIVTKLDTAIAWALEGDIKGHHQKGD
jgi:calcineurin-like phosphoesterase family protein